MSEGKSSNIGPSICLEAGAGGVSAHGAPGRKIGTLKDISGADAGPRPGDFNVTYQLYL